MESQTRQVENIGGDIAFTCRIWRFYWGMVGHEGLAPQDHAPQVQVWRSCHLLNRNGRCLVFSLLALDTRLMA